MSSTAGPDIVQRASFLAGGLEPSDAAHVVADAGATRLRAASLLKPLLLWAAHDLVPLDRDDDRWRSLARPAVQTSDNAAMVEVWEACGAAELLGALAQRSTVEFPCEPGGARAFGRVLVGAGDVARAYAALVIAAASAADSPARELLGWMRGVPEHQTFGVRDAAAQALGVDSATVAVKTGWFCDTDERHLRTHAVTLGQARDGLVVGTVVLTRFAAPEEVLRAYPRTYRHGDEVLPWHERCAGEALREATRRAVAAVA